MSSVRRALLAGSVLLPVAACSATRAGPPGSNALEQVRAAETAFAATMAARDLQAFAGFVTEDAVFINGGEPLRGRPAILEYWKRFFSAAAAPFAWQPEIVEVAGNGTLGYTEGPVTLASGASTSRFYTTWQRQPDGLWRVVFDNGYALCR